MSIHGALNSVTSSINGCQSDLRSAILLNSCPTCPESASNRYLRLAEFTQTAVPALVFCLNMFSVFSI
jgi:hypothetical protein